MKVQAHDHRSFSTNVLGLFSERESGLDQSVHNVWLEDSAWSDNTLQYSHARSIVQEVLSKMNDIPEVCPFSSQAALARFCYAAAMCRRGGVLPATDRSPPHVVASEAGAGAAALGAPTSGAGAAGVDSSGAPDLGHYMNDH